MGQKLRDRVLESVFSVRPAELRLTALLFAQCLCTVGAFIIGRSVRDALFMAHRSSEELAAMYIASALTVTGAGLVYARIADRFRRDLLATVFACLFAVSFAGFRFLVGEGGERIYSALYVFVEVVGALTLIQFWTLANDIFNPRDAKRLFGTIGGGGTAANILLGAFVGGAAKQIGSENLLLICAGLLLVSATIAAGVGKRIPVRLGRGRSANAQRHGVSRVAGSSHLQSVAVLAAVTFVACTLVDFQFKVVAASSFRGDALTAYFGRFYAVCGLLSLAVQFFGTARLLSRFGVVVALAVLPFFLGVGSVAMLIAPGLIAATLAKGSENVFRYTVNDATTQLLYLPAPANVRASAKAFIDGAIKPSAIALTGVALMGYRQFFGNDSGPLALASLVACVGWGSLLLRLRRQYVDALQSTLRSRRFGLGSARSRIADDETLQVLIRALQAAAPKEILNALELLPHLQLGGEQQKSQLYAAVEALLAHPSADVRIAALQHLARERALLLEKRLPEFFADPDPRVRAASISAFCAFSRDRAVDPVRAHLVDPEPEVRAAAIEGLLTHGGLDGLLAAAESLKAMIRHPSPQMREQAARVLGNLRARNDYGRVLELMADSDPGVRRAAIAAAGRLGAPELLPPLLYRLAREETASDAVDALVQYGKGVEPLLAKVLENAQEDAGIRRNVPRVLGRLATVEAIDVLTRHLLDPDEAVRRSVYKALASALRRKPGRKVDRRQLLHAIDFELEQAFRALAAAEALGLGAPPGPSTPRAGPAAAEALLSSALADKIDQCEARLFTLLTILHPDSEIELIHAGYRDAAAQDAQRRKANALELLDNLLDRKLKRKLLPLLDDAPRLLKLRTAAEHYELSWNDAAAALQALTRDESGWVRACAIHLAGERNDASLVDAVREGLEHPWVVVREASIIALQKQLPLGELARAVALRARDEAELIRRRVQDILAAQQSAG